MTYFYLFPVILIFTSSQQQKRKGPNVTTMVQREGQMGLLMQADFCGFIRKILVGNNTVKWHFVTQWTNNVQELLQSGINVA